MLIRLPQTIPSNQWMSLGRLRTLLPEPVILVKKKMSGICALVVPEVGLLHPSLMAAMYRRTLRGCGEGNHNFHSRQKTSD